MPIGELYFEVTYYLFRHFEVVEIFPPFLSVCPVLMLKLPLLDWNTFSPTGKFKPFQLSV
jgi:hypothetical protein